MSDKSLRARLAAAVYPYFVELQTRYTDQDHLGHLNNIAIARLYDEARNRFTEDVRGRAGDLTGMRLVTAQADVSFLDEVFHPDVLKVGSGILGIGRASYEIGQALYQKGRCVGVCRAVFANTAAQGTAPLPENLRAVLKGFMLEPQTAQA